MSRQAKAASHRKIVEAAAQLFKEQGIESTGVADVMQAAGLTHGGFYRHFASKGELALAAVEWAFAGGLSRLQSDMDDRGTKQAISSFIDRYLSEQHVNNPGNGCPIAALGNDAGRGPNDLKDVFESGTNQLIELLSKGFEGQAQDVRLKACGLLFTLVGAVVVARLTRSKASRKKILDAGRRSAKNQMAA